MKNFKFPVPGVELNILFDIIRLDGHVITRNNEKKYICDITSGHIKAWLYLKKVRQALRVLDIYNVWLSKVLQF